MKYIQVVRLGALFVTNVGMSFILFHFIPTLNESQLYLTLSDPSFPVLHYVWELAQTHVH